MKEVINQLENLKSHCEDMRGSDGGSIWARDVAALDLAINFIKAHAEDNPTCKKCIDEGLAKGSESE